MMTFSKCAFAIVNNISPPFFYSQRNKQYFLDTAVPGFGILVLCPNENKAMLHTIKPSSYPREARSPLSNSLFFFFFLGANGSVLLVGPPEEREKQSLSVSKWRRR